VVHSFQRKNVILVELLPHQLGTSFHVILMGVPVADARFGYQPESPPSPPDPRGQFIVLAIHEEERIESPDLLARLPSKEPGGSAHEVDVVDGLQTTKEQV